MNTDEQLFFNGIDGETGEYLFPPLTPEQVSKMAQGVKFDQKELNELEEKNRQVKGLDPDFAPKEGVDPKDLSQTGWGVIFAFDPEAKGANPAIKDALQELLQHRQKQATQKNEKYYQEYIYRPDESKNQFLARYGVGPGPADPDKMPYYLLIVGDPETIPYRFQYQLDVQYAVGRIHFNTPSEYAQYARSVVEAETKELSLSRHASFFGVRNNRDLATKLSADQMIQPLADWMAKDQPDWSVKTLLQEDATKARLGQLLGGKETPSLLFTASHGMGFPDPNHPRLLSHQGSLICQDWAGPGTRLTENDYFSAADVSDEAQLLGVIAFHFACYGAGTPKLDDFAHAKNSTERAVIAPHAFVARLPQRLLSHPKGGALACIGHVERAWGCSFSWSAIEGTDEARRQLTVFQSTLKRLLEGHPVGSAVEYFNERYAELSSDLSSELEKIKYGEPSADDSSMTRMWTANNDARSYAIIGDPAVRLVVSKNGNPPSERSTIGRVVLTPSVPPSLTPEKSLSSVISQPASPPLSPETPLPAPSYAVVGGDVDFGLFDAPRQARDQLTQALNQFMIKLGNALNNATSLEVSTYSSDDMTGVTYNVDSGKFEGTVKLRALTRIAFDGDTVICVPEKDGKVDESLWKTHADMVQQAQTHRAELLKVMVSTATSLLGALKVV